MKDFYTAQELATLNLESLPNSKSNVIRWAKKGSWITRKRAGRGGGVEYAFNSLPSDAQEEIHIIAARQAAKAQAKAAKQLSSAIQKTPAPSKS